MTDCQKQYSHPAISHALSVFCGTKDKAGKLAKI